MRTSIFYIILFFELGIYCPTHSQNKTEPNKSLIATDTVLLSLKDAEAMLIKNNSLLLARHYDIETARAQILQAKLWDNPQVYLETNPYNRPTGNFFTYAPAGVTDDNGNTAGSEVIGAIDQVIKTAGKRSNLVKLNRINAEIAEDVYHDLMRSLKFTLRVDYSLIVQFEQSIELLDNEYQSAESLIRITREQLAKGNFAEKDLLRLQALAFSLQMQRKDFINQLLDVEAEVRTILAIRDNIFIKAIRDSTSLQRRMPDSIDSLVGIAFENRFDLKIASAQIRASSQNLKLQKSQVYPDLDVTVNYTRYSNYITDYVGLGLRLPLPLLNRNEGNIKGAKSDILSSKADYENTERQTVNDVISSYGQLMVDRNAYENFDRPFVGRFDLYFQKLLINFQRRVIGLVEFIDFFETYRDTKLSSFNLEQDYIQSLEQLNFSVGTDVIKP